jgi:hypothetical protein
MKTPSLKQIEVAIESVTTEAVEITGPILAISMISAVVFGVVDALNFLLVEETLTDTLESTKMFPKGTIPLVVGGLSAAVSILISMYIRQILEGYSNLLDSPFLDATGVIIGTIMVILGMKLYTNLFPTILRRRKVD